MNTLPAGTADHSAAAIPAPWTFYSVGQRRLLLAVLFFVATSNYFDYFVISVLLEPIKQEFGVSDGALGALSGLSFAILYAVTALPLARWADRGNRRTVISLSLAAWSIMTALCGMAQSFWQMVAARLAVGAVEPGALPLGHSLIAGYFPPERRASAIALMTQGGSATGWLVGVGLGGYLAAAFGWRMTFFWAGIPGAALAGLTWYILKEPRTRLGFPTATKSDGIAAIQALGGRPTYRMLVCGICMYGVFAYGLTTFLPSFMVRSLHVSMATVGLRWGSAIAIANLDGAFIGGHLADRFGIRDCRWYAWIPAVGCAVAMPLYFLAIQSNRFASFIGFDFAAELVSSAALSPVFVAVQVVSGARYRTLSSACALLLFSLVGGGVGPPLVGYLSDLMLPVFGSESLRYALFLAILFLVPSTLFLWRSGKWLPRDADHWLKEV